MWLKSCGLFEKKAGLFVAANIGDMRRALQLLRCNAAVCLKKMKRV